MSPSAEEFEGLQSQMKSRISDGQGETMYEIGMGGGEYCRIIVSQLTTCSSVCVYRGMFFKWAVC